MYMKFIGAISGSLTGSCTFLCHEESNTNILVDCGMFQGEAKSDKKNSEEFLFDAKKIDVVLLTHAHTDHCGLIPKLYMDGFNGKVITTEATAKLTRLMMLDAGRVSRLYDENDCKKVKFSFIEYSKSQTISRDLRITFSRNSHILGASSINVSWKILGEWKNITFSGDVGCNSEKRSYLPLLKNNYDLHPTADYIVIESTYGNFLKNDEHKNEDKRVEYLTNIIGRTVLEKKGKLIIPVFSLDRSQSVIFDVYKAFLKLKYSKYKKYLGEKEIQENTSPEKIHKNTIHCETFSSLIEGINKIYAEELSKEKTKKDKTKALVYLNDFAIKILNDNDVTVKDFYLKGVKTSDGHSIHHKKQSHLKNKNKNKNKNISSGDILVASSGMGNYGPVVSIIREYIEDENATVLLTGYAPPHTLSGQLKKKEKQVTIHNRQYEVALDVEDMSAYYSAHADQNQLLDFIFTTLNNDDRKPGTVFINHGPSDEVKENFKREIIKRSSKNNEEDKNINKVYIANEEWFNLNEGKFDKEYTHSCFESIEVMLKRLLVEVAIIKKLLIKYEK